MKPIVKFLLFACLAYFCTAQNCPSAPLNVATFNTEQIITASGRQERLNAQIQYFQNATNLDVLCLQELWDPQARQTYIQNLNSNFPYSYYPPNFPLSNVNCSAACTSEAASELSNCLTTQNCFQNGDLVDQLRCATFGCRTIIDNLDDSCRACFSVNRENDLQADITACTTDGSVRDCIRAFGGYTDNLILSKYPIIQSNYLLFRDSPLTETTVLYSRVQAPQGNVNVFCTHLLPANFRFGAFEDTNRNQAQQMLQFINSQVQSSSEPIVAMGDFNFGPEIGNIKSSWPNNYNIFVNGGYQSALIVANNNPPCTFCEENPRVNDLFYDDMIIDHIFVRNAGILGAARFATANVVQVNDRLVPLSDHYGVAASLCLSGNFTTGGAGNTVVIVSGGLERPTFGGASEMVASTILIVVAAIFSFF